MKVERITYDINFTFRISSNAIIYSLTVKIGDNSFEINPTNQ